jgi:hypothetical protein
MALGKDELSSVTRPVADEHGTLPQLKLSGRAMSSVAGRISPGARPFFAP